MEGHYIDTLLSSTCSDARIAVACKGVLGDAVDLTELVTDELFLCWGKAVKLSAVEFAYHPLFAALS